MLKTDILDPDRVKVGQVEALALRVARAWRPGHSAIAPC